MQPIRGGILCTSCGWYGAPAREQQGSAWVAALLTLLFVVPGLVYIARMRRSRRWVCRRCGSPLVASVLADPSPGPAGRAAGPVHRERLRDLWSRNFASAEDHDTAGSGRAPSRSAGEVLRGHLGEETERLRSALEALRCPVHRRGLTAKVEEINGEVRFQVDGFCCDELNERFRAVLAEYQQE